MKQKILTQIEIIQESDAQIFKEKVNDRLRELGTILELTFPKDKGYCAMIKYEFMEEVPESEAERYMLDHGKYYYCNDCPFLELDPDRRSVTHWCSFHEDRVRLKDICCDDFYNGLVDGSFHLVTPAERKKQFQKMDREELERRKQCKYEMQRISKIRNAALAAEKERLETIRKRKELEAEKEEE